MKACVGGDTKEGKSKDKNTSSWHLNHNDDEYILGFTEVAHIQRGCSQCDQIGRFIALWATF